MYEYLDALAVSPKFLWLFRARHFELLMQVISCTILTAGFSLF